MVHLLGTKEWMTQYMRRYRARINPAQYVRVYVLVDPRDRQFRYVGQTQREDLEAYVRHKQRTAVVGRLKGPVAGWLRDLADLELSPHQVVLETCLVAERLERERWWIRQLDTVGHPLLNVVGRWTYEHVETELSGEMRKRAVKGWETRRQRYGPTGLSDTPRVNARQR